VFDAIALANTWDRICKLASCDTLNTIPRFARKRTSKNMDQDMLHASEPQQHRHSEGEHRHFSHELRTPLNHIIGYSELILEEGVETDLQDLAADLQTIQEAGKTLLALVNEAFANRSAPDEKLEAAIASLRGRAVPYLDQLARHINTLQSAAFGHDRVNADLQKISMSVERFAKLLNAGKNSTSTDIAAAAVTTTLTHEGQIASGQQIARRTTTGISGNILIVDDQEINRDMLRRMLEHEGHATDAAENGQQALAMILARPFDLVLLDVMMPGMDGYEMLRSLKANKTLRDIPVIMISALDQIDSVVQCIELGAEDYLPKPCDLVLLRARIGASLEKKRLRDLEVQYLKHVARLTHAAAAVQDETFEPEMLAEVAVRNDELGQLARVFQRMADEIYLREQRLKQQMHELRIVIDEVKKANQIAEITGTDYFQNLQQKVQRLRAEAGDKQT
jgi:DNA-binding response OmpR family regulator